MSRRSSRAAVVQMVKGFVRKVPNPMQRWPFCDKPCICGNGEKLSKCCGKIPLVTKEASEKIEKLIEEYYSDKKKGLPEVLERIKEGPCG